MTTSEQPERPTGYWYDHSDSVVEILHALRRFRQSDQGMRRRMSVDMAMNETDMQALQHVVISTSNGQQATPRDLARFLGISSASTTKLLDRLSASGYLERHPHPTDRRGLVITATQHAHDELQARMTGMHRRLRELATTVPPESRQAVVDFLTAVSDHLETEGGTRSEGSAEGPDVAAILRPLV
jgi:DNA-binding MarR family transcriptional regulator